MKTHQPLSLTPSSPIRVLSCLLVLFMMSMPFSHAQDGGVIAPPELGQETKGTPAVEEQSAAEQAITAKRENQQEEEEEVSNSIFGTATVTESKRESGQVYLIELEHSAGTKQYIEETDSDGKIESTSNDIEETPNLPKWKLGSW
ncbi:MAG: DUF2782 domain-containing protein [Pseudomonadota bacterium]